MTTTIEWTDKTWNPTAGCTRVSPGCDNCYAATMTHRLAAMGQTKHEGLTSRNNNGKIHFNGQVRPYPPHLDLPRKWRKPSLVFVNSMSDLFHKGVPIDYIHQVFKVMNECPKHTFQVLTKRAERLLDVSDQLPWTKNIWMGVSVENNDYLHRIDHLRSTDAKVKFLSLEPLLGPLPDLDLEGIDWVITGGESGPGARPMEIDWARDIRDRCLEANVPFFFKQWGKIQNNPDLNDPTAKQNGGKAKGGRMLDGQLWDQMPIKQTE